MWMWTLGLGIRAFFRWGQAIDDKVHGRVQKVGYFYPQKKSGK